MELSSTNAQTEKSSVQKFEQAASQNETKDVSGNILVNDGTSTKPVKVEQLTIEMFEDETDEEYQDVAEDPLVIVSEKYDEKNEFYDRTISDMINKVNEEDQASKQNSEKDSKQEETKTLNDFKSPKEEESDHVVIQTETDRVKQLMEARKGKKNDSQKPFKEESASEFFNPNSIPKKTVLAKNHSTNTQALYAMEMNDDSIPQESEIKFQPMTTRQVTANDKVILSSTAWKSSTKTLSPKVRESPKQSLFDTVQSSEEEEEGLLGSEEHREEEYPELQRRTYQPPCVRPERSISTIEDEIEEDNDQIIRFSVDFEIKVNIRPLKSKTNTHSRSHCHPSCQEIPERIIVPPPTAEERQRIEKLIKDKESLIKDSYKNIKEYNDLQ